MTPEAAAALVLKFFPQALVRVAKVLQEHEDEKQGDWETRSFWFLQERARGHLNAMDMPGASLEMDPDHACVRALMMVQALYGHSFEPPSGKEVDPLSPGPRANAAA